MNNLDVSIIDVGNIYGNISTASCLYPKSYTKKKREDISIRNRIAISKQYGFNPNYVFMAKGTNGNGSYKLLDRDFVYSYEDGLSALINEDILLITDDLVGVVIGHTFTDYPVIMMSDIKTGVSGVGYCSLDMIDNSLPMMVADSLLEVSGSSDYDIVTYISACASDLSFDKYPIWIRNAKIWESAIKLEDDGLYHVDLRKIIMRQLTDRNINHNVVFNVNDTINNPDYYSNYSKEKGRNFSGLFYKDNSKVLIKTKNR